MFRLENFPIGTVYMLLAIWLILSAWPEPKPDNKPQKQTKVYRTKPTKQKDYSRKECGHYWTNGFCRSRGRFIRTNKCKVFDKGDR